MWIRPKADCRASIELVSGRVFARCDSRDRINLLNRTLPGVRARSRESNPSPSFADHFHARPPKDPRDHPQSHRAHALDPRALGSVIAIDDADEVMVVGDLHGNLPAFRQALAIAALDRHPRRHLVLQELVHEINKNDDDRPTARTSSSTWSRRSSASIPTGST